MYNEMAYKLSCMNIFNPRRSVMVELERRWMQYREKSKPEKISWKIDGEAYACFYRSVVPMVIDNSVGVGGINADTVHRVAFDCIGLPVTYRKERLGFLRPIGPGLQSLDGVGLTDILDVSASDFRTRCRMVLEGIYEDARGHAFIGRKRVLFAQLTALPPLDQNNVPGIYPEELGRVQELRRLNLLDLSELQKSALLREWVDMTVAHPDPGSSHLRVTSIEAYLLGRLRGAFPERAQAAMQAAHRVLNRAEVDPEIE